MQFDDVAAETTEKFREYNRLKHGISALT